MGKKICNKCKIEKNLSEFCKKTVSKDGHGNTCFICVKEYNDNYYKKNKKNILKSQKQKYPKYYKDNKKNINKYSQKYYKENKEEHKKRCKEYYKENKEEHYLRNKEWINNNKERYRELILINNRNRLKNDIIYKIKNNIRSSINSSLKKQKTYKNSKAIKYLGCSVKEFKQYIEKQFKSEMNWGNWGEVWELDHIIGCCNWNLSKIEEQYKCFNFTNYQPLFKTTQIAENFGYENEIGNRNKSKYLD